MSWDPLAPPLIATEAYWRITHILWCHSFAYDSARKWIEGPICAGPSPSAQVQAKVA